MHENFTSLVFFTTLSQAASGALIFREITILRGGYNFLSRGFRLRSLIIITLLLLLSLLIAFFHLGYPINALNAINNLRTSWLSREILCLSLLIFSLLLYLLVTLKQGSERVSKALSLTAVILSILFIFSMIKLYLIPSIALWNHPFTPVSYIITTLLCGILLLIIVTGDKEGSFIVTLRPLIAILILSSIFNSIMFPGSFSEHVTVLFVVRTTLTLVSLIILFGIKTRTPSNKTFTLLVILFVLQFSSEIINRYIFFLSFDKSGL